jgi:hypothetical protein
VVAVVDCFLSKNKPEGIFMATKCLETAISVPLDLRKRVEDALEHVLPTGNWELRQLLPEIGLTVAPILARGLLDYGNIEKAFAIDFFVSFVYEPVIPVLMQLTSDTQSGPFLFQEAEGHHFLTVGEMAITALYRMARTSERARAGLISVLSKSPLSKRLRDWLRPWELLGDEFRPAVRGKRVSTRAKSTV